MKNISNKAVARPKNGRGNSQKNAEKFNVVVIGGSAGAFHVMKQIIDELPKNFPAAVFVVLHIEPERKSLLAGIFGSASKVRVVEAADGARFGPGNVYVATPDFHLRLTQGQMHLDHGPRQNFSRPAIDPLFTSAALAYGSAVVGVILSGALDDGTAGLMDIKRAGGITIVQDPDEAANPSMPASAIDCVEIDYCVPAFQISELLVRISGETSKHEVRDHLKEIDKIPEASLTPHICPECKGPLWFTQKGRLAQFHCRIGHSYSGQSLLVEKSRDLESALWSAVNALKDKALICENLSKRGGTTTELRFPKLYFKQQAKRSESHAKLIQEILLGEESPVTNSLKPRERTRGREAHQVKVSR